MRLSLWFAIVLVGLSAQSGDVRAETVVANQTAKVFSRPGEQATVLVMVKTGQEMTLLSQKGRWLKVRVGGRTGFVPRTKVEAPEADDRETRRTAFVEGRGKKRGFRGEEGPDDRVAADALGETSDEPDDEDVEEDEDEEDVKPAKGAKGKVAKAPAKPVAKGKAKPPVDEEDDEEAEDDEDAEDAEDAEEDDDAKAKRKSVASSDDEEAGEVTESDDAEQTETPKKGGRVIEARGRIGTTLLSQSVLSTGGTGAWPDKYSLSTPSMALALGGSYLMPWKSKFVIGGELTYDLAKGSVKFDPDGGGTMAGSTNGFSIHDFNLRALGGYDLGKSNGMTVFGRLGFHYQSFMIADVADFTKNTAKIPSEVIKAPTLGVGLSIPRITSKIGAHASLDMFYLLTSVTQTKNLEDGENPSAKGMTLGLGGTYTIMPKLHIAATYDFDYRYVLFGKPLMTSVRGHTGTAVGKRDLNHSIAVGVVKNF
jgi:hypothetical protein